MKNKQGFTLAELLIVLGIIGFLSAAAVTTIKPWDKGIRFLYSNTYYALDRAFYNASQNEMMTDPKTYDPFYVPNKGEAARTHSDTKDDGALALCRALTAYINPVDRTSCRETKITKANALDTDFKSENVQFVATNGVHYYITRNLKFKVNDNSLDNIDNAIKDSHFYLIFADMNGDKFPNTALYQPYDAAKKQKEKDPDIFAFAALENTKRIVPLGAPEFNPKYMMARFVYTETKGENEEEYVFSPTSKTYVEIKAQAWNFYNDSNANDSNGYYNLPIFDEALSYNDYVRLVIEKLYPNNNIYKNYLSWEAMKELVQGSGGSENENKLQSDEPYKCQKNNKESCFVMIDKYVQ